MMKVLYGEILTSAVEKVKIVQMCLFLNSNDKL